MNLERSIRNADGKVLAVMGLIVAAVTGAVGLVVSNDSFDAGLWSPVAAAQVIAVRNQPKDATVAADKSGPAAWSADDSSQGTRPDSAH